jgi:endonuclease-8
VPEGDTIARIAAAIRPDLVDRVLCAARCRREGVVGGLPGRRITAIETVGKHMLLHLDDDTTLRVHLGLGGSWHRYAPGEHWKKPRDQMALVLETADDVLVCFGAPTVERLRRRELEAHPVLSELGPDLLADPDLDLAAERAVARAGERTVAEVLLDQRAACGLGNVFKSEILFVERLHPATRAADLDRGRWRILWALGAEMLAANANRPRATREGPGPRVWVYGRTNRPCLRCGTPITSCQQGEPPRTTYWCPTCQPISASVGTTGSDP